MNSRSYGCFSTCEIAYFGDRELSLKGWQDARPTILDQACNIKPISQVGVFWELGTFYSNNPGCRLSDPPTGVLVFSDGDQSQCDYRRSATLPWQLPAYSAIVLAQGVDVVTEFQGMVLDRLYNNHCVLT